MTAREISVAKPRGRKETCETEAEMIPHSSHAWDLNGSFMHMPKLYKQKQAAETKQVSKTPI